MRVNILRTKLHCWWISCAWVANPLSSFFCFQIVNLIEETGHFHITNTTFDFDLCSLDKTTVRKLQSYLETSGTSWSCVQLAAMSRNTRPPDCPPDFVPISLWQCYGISFIERSWSSFLFSVCLRDGCEILPVHKDFTWKALKSPTLPKRE